MYAQPPPAVEIARFSERANMPTGRFVDSHGWVNPPVSGGDRGAAGRGQMVGWRWKWSPPGWRHSRAIRCCGAVSDASIAS
jgi:hypothetical protein